MYPQCKSQMNCPNCQFLSAQLASTLFQRRVYLSAQAVRFAFTPTSPHGVEMTQWELPDFNYKYPTFPNIEVAHQRFHRESSFRIIMAARGDL